MKLARVIGSIMLCSFAIGACSEYNKTKVIDHKAGNEKIYGDVGKPARQLKNKYEPNPKTAAQVKAIKEKLYPSK